MHSPIKANVLQQKINKKLKPGLVVSYNIWPGNREGLFWFRCFINLSFSYLLRHLLTYLQPRDPHGAEKQPFKQCLVRQHQTVNWMNRMQLWMAAKAAKYETSIRPVNIMETRLMRLILCNYFSNEYVAYLSTLLDNLPA